MLPLAHCWSLAVLIKTPQQMARHFRRMEGQFYDREAFDDLARAIARAYTHVDRGLGDAFALALDTCLARAGILPVNWETAVSATPVRLHPAGPDTRAAARLRPHLQIAPPARLVQLPAPAFRKPGDPTGERGAGA